MNQNINTAFEQVADFVKQPMEAAQRGYEDWADLRHKAAGAVLAATTRCAQGVEAVNNETVAYGRGQIHDGVSAARDIFLARNFTDLTRAQAAYTSQSCEKFVQYGLKVTECLSQCVQECCEPFAVHTRTVIERVRRSVGD